MLMRFHHSIFPVRIFVAYSSHQSELAEQIATVLKGEGHKVFFDGHDLDPLEPAYHEAIRDEIRRADLMVFLLSPRSVRDSYAKFELALAKKEWVAPHQRIIPVMAESTSLPSIPGFLRAVPILHPDGDLVPTIANFIDRLARARRRRRWRWMGVGLGMAAVAAAGGLWVVSEAERLPAEPPKERHEVISVESPPPGDSTLVAIRGQGGRRGQEPDPEDSEQRRVEVLELPESTTMPLRRLLVLGPRTNGPVGRHHVHAG